MEIFRSAFAKLLIESRKNGENKRINMRKNEYLSKNMTKFDKTPLDFQ